ncbi:MAG: ATP-binding protein [Pseudomonadota bacterium]
MPRRPLNGLLILLASAVFAGILAYRGEPAFGVFLGSVAAGLVVLLAIEVIARAAQPSAAPPSLAPLPADPEPTAAVSPNTAPGPGFGRVLLEHLPEPVVLIDLRGRITYANPAAAKLAPRLGLGLGDHYATLFRAPDYVEAVAEVIDGAAEQEVEFVTLQGTETHVRVRLSRLPAGTDLGEDPQVLALIEDRTDDVRLARTRSDFIANASHELKTPIASIRAYVETLRGHARDDPEAQDRFLDIMEKQAVRMQRLVEDLMSLNRIELNAHVLPEERCDLHEVAEDAVAAFLPAAAAEGSRVDLDLSQPGPTIQGDPVQLAQVVANLVDNALKYGGPGTHVRVAAPPPDARFPGMVGLRVSDDGPGIERQHLLRLTERFYRVPTRAKSDRGGTGLGLAIVKHIANRHRGELDIRSEVGEGSDFTLWLPAKLPGGREVAPAITQPTRPIQMSPSRRCPVEVKARALQLPDVTTRWQATTTVIYPSWNRNMRCIDPH